MAALLPHSVARRAYRWLNASGSVGLPPSASNPVNTVDAEETQNSIAENADDEVDTYGDGEQKKEP